MVIELKIELIFTALITEKWTCVIEIKSNSALVELHYAIQDAVNFENDHLYEFYISRTDRSRERTVYDDENGLIYSVSINDVFPLEKDRNLYYMFDYGDSWLFKISKTRKREFPVVNGEKYPKLVKEEGPKPIQYPDPDC